LRLGSDVVVDNHRLRVVIRNGACDRRRANGWSYVVRVAVSRIAGVEVAVCNRAESPANAAPDDW